MTNSENKIEKLLKENKDLRKENQKLKEMLRNNNTSEGIKAPLQDYQIQSREEKIKSRIQLFRDLFQGREDVFAIRWTSKKGKSGYSPVWIQNESPYFGENSGNNVDVKHEPLTDQVIYDHLIGKKTIGIYPLLKDDTCWFLAIDFDKKKWQEDVSVLLDVCKEMGVPASLERSRSGNGGHVWIFFSERMPATLARRLGFSLVDRALEKRYQAGRGSYDRLFPNQDKLPKGGFGNLIALPLQHVPRKNNNSVFIDRNFNVYPDQWLYLSNVKKMNHDDIEKVVQLLDRDKKSITIVKETKPIIEKVPNSLKIVLSDGIYISKDGLSLDFIQKLTQLAVINNPAYFKAQARRMSTHNISRKINCSDEDEDYLVLPRGCSASLKRSLKENSIEVVVDDQTNSGLKLSLEFNGKLGVQQEDAVQHMLKHSTGILSASTGFGKTVVAASIIAKRNVNTLVIVHRKQLMEQWKLQLSIFLNIKEKDIGLIGGGKNTATGRIDIATIQTLNHKGIVKDLVAHYGQVIVDECHHVAAYSFENVLKKVNARYVHGLTATPVRKDGLHPIMEMQCGSIRYRVNAKNQAKVRPFKHILVPRYTSFKSKQNKDNIQDLYASLINDKKRNEMIFDDVLQSLDKGFHPIILTERIEHVKKLEAMFKGFAKNTFILIGGMSEKEEQNKFKKLMEIPDGEERLIIATGKYIGEGFDYAHLDTMFLTMPIAWKGTLQQYIGRLHRLHELKNSVTVYDYVDHREVSLKKMFEKRKKTYRSLGYVVEGDKSNQGKNAEQMRLF